MTAMASDSAGTPDGWVCAILICDDQPELLAAVEEVLASNPRYLVVGHAEDGSSCLEQVRATRPDLLILDVNMPGGGPEVVRAVRRIRPTVQIIVFSSGTNRRVSKMLAAGADDYVIKTGRLQPLLDGLNRAADRITTH